MLNTRFALCAIALVLTLAACGGGNKAQNTASPAGGAAASPAASMSSTQRGQGGGYLSATAAPVPAGLNCGAVAPVWVNTRTKAYHLSSDPAYGRTKRGEYICASQAVKEGYHQAGTGKGSSMHAHHRRSGSMMQSQPAPSPAST